MGSTTQSADHAGSGKSKPRESYGKAGQLADQNDLSLTQFDKGSYRSDVEGL
jgi:hypothetical protein